MLQLHPEQYFPAAFFTISILNLVGVALLVASKSWRTHRSKRSDQRVNLLLSRLEANGTMISSQVAGPVQRLQPSEIRQLSESLSGEENESQRRRFRQMLTELGVMARLLTSAGNGTKWRRIDAMVALGRLRYEPAMPHIRRALLSKDSDIVLGAVSALSAWDTLQSIETLLVILGRNCPVNPSRVATAIEQSSVDLMEPLCRKAESTDPVTQFWSATLLGRYNTTQAKETLRALLSSASPNVRAAALTSLSKIGDGGGDITLLLALDDPEWFVRAQAARACGERRLTSSIPKLIPLLRDSVWWVRADAREAIEKIGPSAVTHLLNLLYDDDRFARNSAAEALDNIGYVDATIWDLTKGGSDRERAIDVLAAIRKAEGAPGLEDKLHKMDPALVSSLQERLRLETGTT